MRALPPEGPPPDLLLTELARGLAYWAASFTTLPGQPDLGGRCTSTRPSSACPPGRAWTPMEAGMFALVGELPAFPDAVAALGSPDDAGATLSDLTAAFCRLVLRKPAVVVGPIHAVTPAVAVRTLLPYLPAPGVASAYAQLWHVGAAIVAGFVPSGGSVPAVEREAPPPAEILARAAAHRDTHAVRFAEACVREHVIRPDPVYLLAAEHVLATLPAW